jgi:hypothetical protein
VDIKLSDCDVETSERIADAGMKSVPLACGFSTAFDGNLFRVGSFSEEHDGGNDFDGEGAVGE